MYTTLSRTLSKLSAEPPGSVASRHRNPRDLWCLGFQERVWMRGIRALRQELFVTVSVGYGNRFGGYGYSLEEQCNAECLHRDASPKPKQSFQA